MQPSADKMMCPVYWNKKKKVWYFWIFWNLDKPFALTETLQYQLSWRLVFLDLGQWRQLFIYNAIIPGHTPIDHITNFGLTVLPHIAKSQWKMDYIDNIFLTTTSSLLVKKVGHLPSCRFLQRDMESSAY